MCVWTIWIDVKLLHVTDVVSFFLTSWMFQTRDSLFSNCTSRGMERTYEAPSNEAPHMILGYHQGRLVTYLLHFCLWRPAKPRTGMTAYFGTRFYMVLHGCRNLDTCLLDFTFSQNWDSNWLIQVIEAFSYLFLGTGIWSLRGTWASTAWVLSISC